MNGVFDGLTVVELADRRNQWAGKLLSDGGARVIQIEPTAGGPGRWCGPFVDDTVDPDRCLDYWWYNTGKQSVALDVGRPPAQDLLRRLLAGADVFLESTPPGTLRAYGLDHGSVSSNRALIYTSLTDFGQDGPWRDYRMNDAAHLALGGHMASTGYSDPTLTPIGGQGHQALAHGLRVRVARHHAGPLRPHDDRQWAVHRRLDPRCLLDRHRVRGTRVALQRRHPLSADRDARLRAPAARFGIADG